MSKRPASLVQADYDRAATALVKLGMRPEIIFNLTENTVRVVPANDAPVPRSSWQEKAPDRV